MTRKDYVSIAKAIKAERTRIVLMPRSTVAQRTLCLQTLENVATYLIAELRDNNPKFNEILFREACNLPMGKNESIIGTHPIRHTESVCRHCCNRFCFSLHTSLLLIGWEKTEIMQRTYTLPDTIAGNALADGLRDSLLDAGFSVGITHEDIGSTKYPARVLTITATLNKQSRKALGLWTGEK